MQLTSPLSLAFLCLHERQQDWERGLGSGDLYEKQPSLQDPEDRKVRECFSFVHLFWKTDLKVSNYFINCHTTKHFCPGMMALHVSGLQGKILTCCELNGEQFKTGYMEWGGNDVYGKHMAKLYFSH